MKYEELIKHILVNAVQYIDDYSRLDKLDDKQKGVLLGLWISLDCINNQLALEELDINYDIEKIMDDLLGLIND